MSRLNQIEEMMANPDYDERTHFIVDDNEKLAGTNNSNELFVLYHRGGFKSYRNFLSHEYVVHLLAGFSEFL